MYVYTKVITDRICCIDGINPRVLGVNFKGSFNMEETINYVVEHYDLNTDGAFGVTVEHFISEV